MDTNKVHYDTWLNKALIDTSTEQPNPISMSRSIPLTIHPPTVLIGGDASLFCSNQPLDEELLTGDGDLEIVKIIENTEKKSEKDGILEKNKNKSNFPL